MTSQGKHIILDRDEEDMLTVDGVKILVRDIVGTNGVIHVIEDVLVGDDKVCYSFFRDRSNISCPS